MYLIKKQYQELIAKEEFVIRPILSDKQFGEISMDFRLGTDFLVSQLGREPFIDVTGDKEIRPIQSYFVETKRLLGEPILLHPNQTILASTLEYIKLPTNVFLSLNIRSSFGRLGIIVSSIVQPGYCGSISLELTNSNIVPIKLMVGTCIVQGRFFQLEGDTNYFNKKRKYTCQVRPISSRANEDEELKILNKIINAK